MTPILSLSIYLLFVIWASNPSSPNANWPQGAKENGSPTASASVSIDKGQEASPIIWYFVILFYYTKYKIEPAQNFGRVFSCELE